jgi:uncharacterized protein YndB with AHSA1/START domain
MTKTEFVIEPGKQEVVITHEYNAARELVFKTLTDPKLIPKWWGPQKYNTIVDKMDVRAGGVWRFVSRDAQGNVFAFHGVYHQVLPPEKLVYTFEFEGAPGHVSLETVVLEEQNGKTISNDNVVFQSVEDRDGMVQHGMQEGATESINRFSALLERICNVTRWNNI